MPPAHGCKGRLAGGIWHDGKERLRWMNRKWEDEDSRYCSSFTERTYGGGTLGGGNHGRDMADTLSQTPKTRSALKDVVTREYTIHLHKRVHDLSFKKSESSFSIFIFSLPSSVGSGDEGKQHAGVADQLLRWLRSKGWICGREGILQYRLPSSPTPPTPLPDYHTLNGG